MAEVESKNREYTTRLLAQILLGSLHKRIFYFCSLLVTTFVFSIFNLYLWQELSDIDPFLAKSVNFHVFDTFALLVAIYAAVAFVYFVAHPKSTHAMQKLLSCIIISITSFIFVYCAYIHGFTNAWMGSYFAVLLLLGVIVFNRFVNTIFACSFVASVGAFMYLIEIQRLPSSPFFASDIQLSSDGIYYLCWSILTSHVIGIVIFAFLHQSLMLSRRSRENHLAKVSQTDMLSGLLNRNQITSVILKEIQNTKKSKNNNLGIIIADIDFFKKINDTHGHAMGDKVIQVFAKLLSEHVEPYGHAGRHGGDEFVIVMPNSTQGRSLEICESIRLAFSKTLISHAENACYATASFGTVNTNEVNLNTLTMDNLLKIADTRLYSAKNNGRNQVVSTS